MEEVLNAMETQLNVRKNTNILELMSMNRILIIICTLLLFSNCTEKLPTIELILEKKVDALEDSILFANLKCLTMHNGNLFVTDISNNQLICMDKELNLVMTIGKAGSGPGELLEINQFAIKDSSIVVLNGGNYRINIFKTDGKLIKEYSLINSAIHFHTAYRFGYVGTQLIGCSSLPDTPLDIYDIHTGKQTLFGEAYKFSSPVQEAIRNGRFVALFKDSYIVVSDNMPYIEVYNDKTKKLTAKYDYSSIRSVERTLKAVDEYNKKYDNSYSCICEDIYVDNDYLYILFANFGEKYAVNEIIKFKLSPKITPSAIIKLPGKIYSSFCVADTHLYVYNKSKNMLEKYKMIQNVR